MNETRALPRLGLLTTFGLMAGPFLSMVDSNIVNVGVPTIARDLHASLAVVQWTLSGYLLAMGGALALTPFLAKRFGMRPVYLGSVAAFAAASALCALSPSIQFLIAARALQGAAGAPLVPLAMSMMMGRSETVRQMSPVAAILLFMAPAAGPTVGGLLIPPFGWPSIFLINLPFGIAGIVGALRLHSGLAAPRQPGAVFDVVGFTLLAVGMTFTLYGASQGPSHGWWSTAVWPFWAIGVAAVVGYVAWALRRQHPAVDLKLLLDAQNAIAVLLSVITSAVLFAALFLIPVFMQSIQGSTPLQAGLALLPQGVVLGVATMAGSALVRRLSVRTSVLIGMLLLTAMTAGLLSISLNTPAWQIALILAGRGVAMGLVVTQLVLATLSRVPTAEAADANTLFNVVQRLGGSFGIALLATFLQAREQVHVAAVLRPLGIAAASLQGSAQVAGLPAAVRSALGNAAVAGFHDTFILLTAISAAGTVLALLLKSPAAASQQEPVIVEAVS